MSLFSYYRVVAKSAQTQLEFTFDFNTLAVGMPEVVNSIEGARIIGKSPKTLVRWYHEGKIPAIDHSDGRGGMPYGFLKSVLIEYMKKNHKHKNYDN